MIIGLVGLAGAGKSTVAEILARDYEMECLSVAAPIRAMLASLGVTDELTRGRAKERPLSWLGNRSPRHLMNSLGDWIKAECGSNVLAQLLAERLLNRTHAVVDDIRFPSEAIAIRAKGGRLWRITRGHSAPAIQGHVTERAGQMIDCDAEIMNVGSLVELEIAVQELMTDA